MELDGSGGKQCQVCGMLFPPDASVGVMRSHGYKCRGPGAVMMPVNTGFSEDVADDGRRRRSAVKAMHSFAQGHCGDLDADLDYGDDDERLQIPVDETEDDPSFVPDEVVVKVEEEDDYEYQDDTNALEEDTDSGQSEEEFVSEMDDDVLQGKRKTPRVKKTAEDGGTIREFPNDAHSVLTKYLEMQYAWERRLDPRTVRIVYFKHFASQWKSRSERPDGRLEERRHLFVPDPATWTPIPENQVLKYLPTERNSMRYQTPGNAMKQLNLFEVDKEENMWFTGGFVRAMAWNPQTFKDGFQKAQYLAVATYRDVTSVQPYLDVKTSVGMVQIWECKQLSVEETGVPPSPRLALGLGHTFGKVLALTWLSPFSAASCHEQPHHLGTLALAATDGVVHLLPIALPNGGAVTAQSSVFYTSSQWLSLGIPPTAIDPNALQRFGFPTCVESRPEFPHLIVAGYNTGYVAMWSLTTFCPWLEEYKYIPSIRCFRGTNGPMFSVALDPLSGRNILCAGHERPLKLWHIDDPSQSHIAWAQQRAGSCRAFSWAGRGDLVCSVHEDNYGAVQAGVYLQAVHAPQKVSLRVTEHQGAARDCSFSDLLSSLVFSTQEGLVSAIPIGRHLYDTRACREFAKSKPAFTVMSLNLKEIQNATVFPGQTQGCGRCGQTNNYAMCYRCVEAKFVLDINRTNGSDKTSLTYHLWQSQAVTRVAFNPNPAACTWLAFGTAGGLVRIERVDRLMYSEMRDFLKCLCEQPEGVSVASLSSFVDQSLATQQQSRRNVGGRSRKKAGGPAEEEDVNSQDTESTLPAVDLQLDLTPGSTPCVHKELSPDDRASLCSQDSASTVPCQYEDGREMEMLSDISPVPTPPAKRGGRGGSRRGAARGRGRGGAKTPGRGGGGAGGGAGGGSGQRRRGGGRGRRKTAIEVVMEAIGVGAHPHELEAQLAEGQVSQVGSSDTCRSIAESNAKEGGEEERVCPLAPSLPPDATPDAPPVTTELPRIMEEKAGEKDEDKTPPLFIGLPEDNGVERAESEAPSVEYEITVPEGGWESDSNEVEEKADGVLAIDEVTPSAVTVHTDETTIEDGAEVKEIVAKVHEVAEVHEMQTTTEVQEMQEAQKTAELQEAQKTAELQEVQKAAEVQEVQKAAEVQEVQKTAEVQEVQKVQKVKKVKKVQMVPKVQMVQKVQKTTEVHEVQKVQTAEVHEVHKTAEVHEVQKTAEVHEVQKVQKTAEVHEMQKTAEVQVVQEVQKAAEVAAVDIEKADRTEEVEPEPRADEAEVAQFTPKRRRGRPPKSRAVEPAKEVGEEKENSNQPEPDSVTAGEESRSDVAAGSRDRKLRSAGRPQELDKWREPGGRPSNRSALSDDGASSTSSQSSRWVVKKPPLVDPPCAPRRARRKKQPEAVTDASSPDVAPVELQTAVAAATTPDFSAVELKTAAAAAAAVISPDLAPVESKATAAVAAISPDLPPVESKAVAAIAPDAPIEVHAVAVASPDVADKVVTVGGKRGRRPKSQTLAATAPPLKRRRKSKGETAELTERGATENAAADQSEKKTAEPPARPETKAKLTTLTITNPADIDQRLDVDGQGAEEPVDADLTPPLPDDIVQTNALEMAKSAAILMQVEASSVAQERKGRIRRQRSSSKTASQPPADSEPQTTRTEEKGEALHVACEAGSSSEPAAVELEKESVLDVSPPSCDSFTTAVLEVTPSSQDDSVKVTSGRSIRRGRPKAKDTVKTVDGESTADVQTTTSMPPRADVTAAQPEKAADQPTGRRRRNRQSEEKAKSQEDVESDVVADPTSPTNMAVVTADDHLKTEKSAAGRRRARSSVEKAMEKAVKDEAQSADVVETSRAKTPSGRKARRPRLSEDKGKDDDVSPPNSQAPEPQVSVEKRSPTAEHVETSAVAIEESVTGTSEHVGTTAVVAAEEKISGATAVTAEEIPGPTAAAAEEKIPEPTAAAAEGIPGPASVAAEEEIPGSAAVSAEEKTLKDTGAAAIGVEEKVSSDRTPRRGRQSSRKSEDAEGGVAAAPADEMMTQGSPGRGGRRRRQSSEKEKKVEVESDGMMDRRQSDVGAAGPEEGSQSAGRFPRRRRQSTEKGELLQHGRSTRTGRQKADDKNSAPELPPSSLLIDVESTDIRSCRGSQSTVKTEEVIILDSPVDESPVPDVGKTQEQQPAAEDGLSRSARRQRLSADKSRKADDGDTPTQPVSAAGRSGRRGRPTSVSTKKDSPPTAEETACPDAAVQPPVGDVLCHSPAEEVKSSVLSPPAADTDAPASLHDTSSDANTLTPAPETKEDPESVDTSAHLTLRPRTMTKSGVRCLQPVSDVQEVPMVDLTLISDSESDARASTPSEDPSRARARQRELELVKGKARRVKLVTIEWVEGKWSGVRQPVPISHLDGTPVEGGVVHVRWPRRSSKRKWAARVVSVSFMTRSRSSSNTSTGPADLAAMASPDPEVRPVSQKVEPEAVAAEPEAVSTPQEGETSVVELKAPASTPELKPKSATKAKPSRKRASADDKPSSPEKASDSQTPSIVKVTSAEDGEKSAVESSVPASTPESKPKSATKAKPNRKRASPATDSDNAAPPVKRPRPPAPTPADTGKPKPSPPTATPHLPAAAKAKAKAVMAVRKKEADVVAQEPMAKRSRPKKVEAVVGENQKQQQQQRPAAADASAVEKTPRRARPGRVSAESTASAEDGSKLPKKQTAKKG